MSSTPTEIRTFRLAGQKLDEVRRRVQNETLGHLGRKADPLYRARKLLVLAQERLDEHTDRQQTKLAWVAKSHPRLHRAYLLKEGLRVAFQLKGQAGKDAIDRWILWARRCRIPSFVQLQRRIVKNRTRSTPPSTTACPKDSSSPPTPRSAS